MKSKENKSSYGCLIFFLVMMGITYFEYVILILGIILIILAVYYFSKNKNNLNDFKNGVIFADKVKATDAYGNETKINSIILWISPETLDKINFANENWGKSPEDIYNVADAVHMSSEVETSEFKQKDSTKDTPDTYFYLIAEGY